MVMSEEEKAAKKIIDMLRRSQYPRNNDHYLNTSSQGYDSIFFDRVARSPTFRIMARERLKSYYRGHSAYRGCRIEQLSRLHRLYRSRDPHVQGIRDRLITDNASAGVSIMRFINTMTTFELLDHGV